MKKRTPRRVGLALSTLALLPFFFGSVACTQDPLPSSGLSVEEIRQALSAAENEGDVDSILGFLAEDVVFTYPGERPVLGREPVEEFLRLAHGGFVFRTSYRSRGPEREGTLIVDRGEVDMTFEPREGGESQTQTMPYEWIFRQKAEGGWGLEQLTYGTLEPPESLVPDLPIPSGNHAVGVLNRVLQDENRGEVVGGVRSGDSGGREVAVQLWYPAIPHTDAESGPYQTPEAATALAAFLGWPRAFNSFFPLVGTNSILDSQPDPSSGPFPLLIYNHGYSGFTGVHQALIEDLVSHGYVVASVGHAFESSLFVLPEGGVRTFDPANPFYAHRLEEASDPAPEAAKDRILRATSLGQRAQAYEDLLRLSPLHQASARLWAEDSRFVLDILRAWGEPGERMEGMMDLSRVGALGHSLGGATAGQLLVDDPRVDAGINMDGFQFGDLLSTGVQKPFLFMAAQRPWAGDSLFVNDLFVHQATAPAYGVIVRGFEHGSFTDLPLFGLAQGLGDGADAGVRALELQREVVRGFFDQALKGVPSDLLNDRSRRHPHLIIVRGGEATDP